MKDLTVGKPAKAILHLALPLFIGNLFQILYILVDGNIVGQILGDNATGAIGAVVPVMSLIVGFATGLGTGFALLVARHFGSKNIDKVRQSIALIYVLGLVIVGILTIISCLNVESMLRLLQSNESLIPLSSRYLFWMLLFMFVTFFYNIMASILRAIGDSIVPIIFLVITTIVNIGLDYLFLLVFKWDIESIAIATIVSQLISGLGCYLYMYIKYPLLRLQKGDFKFTASDVIEMGKQGMAYGIMMFLIQIGTVCLQWGVNGLGTQYITAQAAARKVDEALMNPLATLGLATSTFVAQNYGLKKFARIKSGIYWGMIMGFIYSGIMIILMLTISSQLVYLFTSLNDQAVVEYASLYLKFNFLFYPVLAMLFILRSSLQAFNHKLTSLSGAIIEMSFKILFVLVLIPKIGYWGVIISEPLIWVCSVTILMIIFLSDKNIRVLRKQKLSHEV